MVEDDVDLAGAILLSLEDEGWQVEHIPDGHAGLRRAQSGEHDLIILDVRLPGLDGFEICREVRRNSRTPILFLTARGAETDKVVGLELGGDDYLTKPFGIRELQARVKALLRRTVPVWQPDQRLRVSDLTIWPEKRVVCRGSERIHLTNSEFILLMTLAQRPGMVFTRDRLMEALWEPDLSPENPITINVHIRNLREKLGDNADQPRYIHTVRGVGYTLKEDP